MGAVDSSAGWARLPRFIGGLRTAPAAPCPTLDSVKRAMLEALGERLPMPYQALPARILHALDAQRLWQLRGELMQALSAMHGELHARQEVERINALFQAVLPRGLASSLARRGPG